MAAAIGITQCFSMKRKTRRCDRCGHFIALPNFKRHATVCAGIGPTWKREKRKSYICECGQVFSGAQALNAHASWCVYRGKSRVTPNKGQVSPLKGRTYDDIHGTNAEVIKNKLRDRLKSRGCIMLEKNKNEWKKKLSIARIKYLENCPHVNWYEVGGIKVQGSWEKRIAEKLVELGIEFNRPRIKYDSHRTYTPDFFIPALNVYIEVKGWMRERDKIKYRKVIRDNSHLSIKSICGKTEVDAFIAGNITINDLRDIRDVI